MMRLFIGITGASGAIYGIRVLEMLRRIGGVEVHLSVSSTAGGIIRHETGLDVEYVKGLADYYWEESDMYAPPASGSFPLDGMAVVPCSTKTLAAVANGISDNLITRAAEVALKERRRLVLVIRESPLSLIHLENMVKVSRAGAVIMPASPGFYHRPATVDELVDFVAGRVLDLLGVKHSFTKRWGEDKLI